MGTHLHSQSEGSQEEVEMRQLVWQLLQRGAIKILKGACKSGGEAQCLEGALAEEGRHETESQTSVKKLCENPGRRNVKGSR